MLVRIVKLSLKPKGVDIFKSTFETHKYSIREFKGCNFLELYQDLHNTNVFFTYSYWDNEAALNSYRNSDLFKHIWSNTKPLFNAKPEAWSVNKLETLN